MYADPIKYAGAWNFGPSENNTQTVSWILNKFAEKIPNATWQIDKKPQLHEANLLKLNSSKAKAQLDWICRWSLDETLNKIIEWQEQFEVNADLKKYSMSQIADYVGAR